MRLDDTADGPARQKTTPARPTTLDLNAVEIRSESPAAPPESFETAEDGATPAASEPETSPAQSGETPQEPDGAGADGTAGEAIVSEHAAAEHPAEAETHVLEVLPEPKLDVFDDPAREGVDALDVETPRGEGSGPAEAAAEAAGADRAPPQPAFLPSPPPSKLPVVLAGLLGGVAGAVLVVAALSLGLVPFGRGNDDLSPRLVAAEQDIASNKSAIDQAASRAAAAEDAAKSARDAANNALNLAGEAQKAAPADTANAAPAAPPVDLGPLTDRLAKAEADIASLHSALDQAAQNDASAIAPVKDQAAAAAAAVSQVQSGLQDTQKQVAALASSTSTAANKAAAYAVALGQMGEAVRQGRPFGAELRTAAGIGGQADALAPLTSLAETGVPSIETLAADFDALKPQIVAALTPKPSPPPPDAGVMDRLMSSLGHVVVVTREGDGSPGDPAAPAQKVSDTLHRGDLPGAVAAFKAMPEPAQQAGAAWLSQASQALGALDAIKAETDAALQKLSSQ
jgi:hypothetical protein